MKLKYKVDDKLYVALLHFSHEFKIGEEVTITQLCLDDTEEAHYKCHGENDYWWLMEEELSETNPLTPS